MGAATGDDIVEKLESIRMLYPEALRMLQRLASRSEGVALEVGPYIGASSIAIASGRSDLQLLTIEIGGSRLDHDHAPSADILADLRRNLVDFGVADRVAVIDGWSHDPAVVAEVSSRLAGRKIGLLFFDANGELPMFIANYGQHLSATCILAFDDYRCGLEKSLRVDATVELLLWTGAVRQIGVAGGTWFGEVAGPGGLAALRRAGNPFAKDEGYCVIAPVTGPWQPDSRHGDLSRLRLFEDGRELGPAHTVHLDIRSSGCGRFSHYLHEVVSGPDGSIAALLYFSASDNTDPATNGRRYTALIGSVMLDLHDGTLLEAGDVLSPVPALWRPDR